MSEDIENNLNFNQAVSSLEKGEWQRAIEKECSALLKIKAWILSELPDCKKPICSRLVFKVKRKDDGTIKELKAHF